MRNNIQNDVKIEKAAQYPTKLDFSGSVSTTCTLGEVSVSFSRAMQPGSKALCGQEQLINMAPLVAPTYSKSWYKTWHYFVPIKEVWPNYDAFMTKTPISRNGNVFTPSKVPFIAHDILSMYVLVGAKCNLYFREINVDVDTSNWTVDDYINSDLWFDVPQSVYIAGSATGSTDENAQFCYGVVEGALDGVYLGSSSGGKLLDVGEIINCTLDSDGLSRFRVPIGNMNEYSFLRDDVGNSMGPQGGSLVYNMQDVGFCEGDYQLFREISVLGRRIIVCYEFKLSNFGARLDKVLAGLGLGVDFDDRDEISILPLLATYCSYWNSFGLEKWRNLQTTYCGRIITYITNSNNVNMYRYQFSLFDEFMVQELGMMFVTEKTDYVSAHLPQPTISAVNDTPLKGVVDVTAALSGNPTASAIQQTDTSSSSGGPNNQARDGHAYLKILEHGNYDAEVIRRLYKRTNANTALGKDLKHLMITQGLAYFIDHEPSYYIGETSVSLNVNRVTSQSDTYDSVNDSGAALGQYAGQGIGYRSGKKEDKFEKLFYQTDVFGWWICLDAVTCESGYAQSEDITWRALTPDKYYQPDYDDLGLQLDSQAIVTNSRDSSFRGISGLSSVEFATSSKPNGFAPRFSEWKVGRNSVAGGFKLKSQRKNFTPYIMDKLVYVDLTTQFGSRLASADVSVPSRHDIDPRCMRYNIKKAFGAADMATAGDAYRFLGRYPWLGNLARIFHTMGSFANFFSFILNNSDWEYYYVQPDNYIILQEVYFKCWANVLPIEETYGTIDHDRKELEYVDRV